ncbi:MAG: alcohol dehydrogenase catalytic domain-containing protein [Theionarchaea archaeon]|nr:alcohol dehydrogenase catalytic domain-containing protein [Theionarchaea archaeon]
MRAAVYYGVKDFRVEELPVPEIGVHEALVKVEACGICGTDVHKAVHKTVEPPIVLGHEVAGDVVDIGKNVQKFQVGDSVVVPHHTPCFACFYCHHGHPTLCEQYTKTNIDPGGFSEYIRVPQPNVERAMLHIGRTDYEEAAFVEPVACCIHAWERVTILPGDAVLIVGAGPIGLLHLELAKVNHAGTVYMADVKENRLKLAEKRGGIPINVNRDTAVKGDIVIVAAGNKNAYEYALKSVRKGGQISFFAECPPDSQIVLDPNLIYSKELTVTGSYSSTPFGHWKALNLIKKTINVKELITHRFGLEDLGKAIEMAYKAEECLKIMIRP